MQNLKLFTFRLSVWGKKTYCWSVKVKDVFKTVFFDCVMGWELELLVFGTPAIAPPVTRLCYPSSALSRMVEYASKSPHVFI